MLFSTILGTISFAGIALSQTFTNPIRNPGADPHIVTLDGYYYLTNTQGGLISVTRSATIGGLYEGETRTVYEDSDPNRNQNVWAPEMHRIDGVWYILYSAGAGDIPTGQRSFVLQGCDTNPYDCEYTFLAELTPAPGSQGGSDGNDPWSIDGTFIIIGEGRYHVVSAHNSANVQSIMITALDTTNWTVGPWSIISEPTEDWEMANPPPDGPAAVNEAPNPLYNSGRTWLSFSTSFCGSPSYALGLLEYNGSGDPLDPASWVKTGPVFSAASENYSTAHNVFFSSPDGTEVWNAYHATTNPEGSCGTDRYTMAQIVTFDETGFPFLGEPVWGLTDIQVPSGDGA